MPSAIPFFFPLIITKIMTTFPSLCDLAPTTFLTLFPDCASATLASWLILRHSEYILVSRHLNLLFCCLENSSLSIHFGVCSNVRQRRYSCQPFENSTSVLSTLFPNAAHFLYSTNDYLKLYDYLAIVLLPH